ncbi:MAG TPA: VWA domain-containing protein, partial [Pyrinomonadaceae bacterium]|nr:VWA domain-containing protein [Pyrinomonadaceae bacterium]
DSASAFLRFGGSATLHFVNAASSVLRSSPEVFESWNRLACTLGDKRIATMLAFLRITPTIISRLLKSGKLSHEIDSILKTLLNIAETDSEAALAAFRSSSAALLRVSAEKFDQWASAALERLAGSGSKARRSYFALETRQSRRELEYGLGLYLEEIAPVLRVYIEGLTGRSVEIVSFASALRESRIGDGKTIALPSAIDEFDEVEENFRLFKVLAAYGAGQIEFGTFAKDTAELKKVYQNLSALYTASAEEKDAFSLAGYLEDISNAQRGLTESEIEQEFKKRARKLPPNSDYKEVLKVFPDPQLARRIFGLLENARIDFLLRRAYRGLRKDLDLMQKQLYRKRPSVFELPAEQVPFELLFQVTLCGGTSAETRAFYGQALSEIEAIIERYLKPSSENITPTVADTVYATSRIFELFDAITPQKAVSDDEVQDTETEDSEIQSFEEDTAAETDLKTDREQNKNDLREIFNAWNQVSNQPEPQNLDGAELWASSDVAEQSLEPGDEAFNYDEWDRELGDYRVGWSRVIERRARLGERDFVELVRSRYRGVISSIRRQFQLMKPENLSRVNRELDGEDYDLNSLVEHIVDRRADGRPSEAIYTKRLRKTRDVAVLILLDQSSSTARTITRNPLQPYTHPGRRIIEIEKEGLVLMSEALEAVGDSYAITGFTSEGRRNVKFYVVKDFHERYSSETARRIGGITFQNNTRLGAAIRHASRKLLRYQARTRLMIILTDGRPYDHDYGDARYAREDVREALTEAKINGITPFCITIDRESETELKDLYGDVGYTIIDDVLSLPEKMPGIYRRLTR